MPADPGALRQAFRRRFGRGPELIAEAPGRVNLIGEHTDYNQGFVLPVAIDRTVAVAAAARNDGTVRVHSLDLRQRDEFGITDCMGPGGRRGWRDYVRGAAWALGAAGHTLRGADLAISGDVPRGAGLSSSAALEVAVAGALAAVSDLEMERRELALTAQRAENVFVGVQCGIMDQMSAALGRAGRALLIDCRSLEVEHPPLPDGALAVVVLDSGVRRRLSRTAYNTRRRECAEAARRLGAASLRDADAAMLKGGSERLGDLLKRARHVVTENARVLAAAGALRAGDIAAFGRLMYESHRSLREDFEVSLPELDLLVELARLTPGVAGSRLTGAGFGGCTVSLVQGDALEGFRRAVLAPYEERTGRRARMHVCRAVDGLRVTHV